MRLACHTFPSSTPFTAPDECLSACINTMTYGPCEGDSQCQSSEEVNMMMPRIC